MLEAEQKLSQAKKDKEDFIFQYEEAQKKKRKKKLRVARTEKDEEELLFDAEKEEYQEKINAAEDFLSERKAELDAAHSKIKSFETMYSPGSFMLDKARASVTALLTSLKKEFSDHEVDFQLLLENYSTHQRYDNVMRNLSNVVNFLREKKDRVVKSFPEYRVGYVDTIFLFSFSKVLVEALKLQSDLLLLFGNMTEARKLLHDLVDGLFNSIDACIEWPKVAQYIIA